MNLVEKQTTARLIHLQKEFSEPSNLAEALILHGIKAEIFKRNGGVNGFAETQVRIKELESELTELRKTKVQLLADEE